MVATETEATTAKSTGPTVNIQTTEAEPVHTTAELTVKTMSAEPAEGQLDYVVTLQEDIGGNSLGDPPEQLRVLGIVPSSNQLQQCTSVEVMAEKWPVATNVGLDESLSGSSALRKSALLTCVTEKENGEVIHKEGEDAGVEGGALMSKNGKDGFRFAVDPAYIKDCEKEEKLPSTEEEHCVGEAAETCVEEQELAGEKMQTEVNGKRVHFSNEVQYFEEEEFSTELEDCIEEVDEEIDQCSPPQEQKTFLDSLKPLPFKKEKYYVQMDSSEDEIKITEEDEMDGRKEELKDEYDEEQELAEDGVDEREDGVPSEKVREGEMESSPHELTQTEPFASDASPTSPPPAVSQSEVTLHQLQWPRPRPCNLTSILPSCRHTATNNQRQNSKLCCNWLTSVCCCADQGTFNIMCAHT